MKQNFNRILAATLVLVITILSSGCSKQRDYGENFNLETDYQYSYDCNFLSRKIIQSDGDGQYISKNQFIYYYNTEKGTMAPLCNKPNCLHDMETDKSKYYECNAYMNTRARQIQYYDGYIYYFASSDTEQDIFDDSLYRVKKDGSKKDKIFTLENELQAEAWIIHRGYLYYVPQEYYYDSDNATQIYFKGVMKAVELSSSMSEKNAKVIYDIGEYNSLVYGGLFKAYKDYFVYELDVKSIDAGENVSVTFNFFLYNTKTEENSLIPVPEGYGEKVSINKVVFLEDKMLFTIYDPSKDPEYKLPVYSINYDLTDEKIWLNDVEQGKWVQSYDNKVIITDGNLHYDTIITEEGTGMDVLKGDAVTNVSIYSSDAELISYFVYPMNIDGSFIGFGPDGMKLEIEESGENWLVYRLNIKDVLNCHGEKVKLDLISTRRNRTVN